MKKILFLAAFSLTLGVAMAQQPVKPAQAAPQQAQPAAQHQCSGQHANCPHHQAQAQQPKQEAKPACNGQHANCPHHQAAQQAQPATTQHVDPKVAAPKPCPKGKKDVMKPENQTAAAAPKK